LISEDFIPIVDLSLPIGANAGFNLSTQYRMYAPEYFKCVKAKSTHMRLKWWHLIYTTITPA